MGTVDVLITNSNTVCVAIDLPPSTYRSRGVSGEDGWKYIVDTMNEIIPKNSRFTFDNLELYTVHSKKRNKNCLKLSGGLKKLGSECYYGIEITEK